MGIQHGWYEQERYIYELALLAPWTLDDIYHMVQIKYALHHEQPEVVDYIIRVPDVFNVPHGNILPLVRDVAVQQSNAIDGGVSAVLCTSPFLNSIGRTLHEIHPPLRQVFQMVQTDEEALAVINRTKRQRAKRATGQFERVG